MTIFQQFGVSFAVAIVMALALAGLSTPTPNVPVGTEVATISTSTG